LGTVTEPIVEPEVEGVVMARAGKRRRGLRFYLGRIFVVLIVLGLIPVVLTILYMPSFVHPISTLMIKDLVTFSGYDRQWVALDDVAPILKTSVIMSEDGQFCYHQGVDWGEFKVVVDDLLAGEMPSRGASTITMQTVKNLYLWHRPLGSVRKVVEVPLAIYFDVALSKKRIMEIYLNIADWGPNIYGIEAASQHYFDKPAKSLSARQAALLAITLPNPIDRNPAKPDSYMKKRAARIQSMAANNGAQANCLK
jgi:monofunctional biosynthetic peptidoglycan transglycosylase